MAKRDEDDAREAIALGDMANFNQGEYTPREPGDSARRGVGFRPVITPGLTPPPTPGDVHNFTRSPDQLKAGAIPLLTNRGAGGAPRVIPPIDKYNMTGVNMGRGVTPTLERQNLVPSAQALDLPGRELSFREVAARELQRGQGGVNQTALDKILGRLDRALTISPDEERNNRVTLDQIAWTNSKLGAKGTSGIGGRAMTALSGQMDREAQTREGNRKMVSDLLMKGLEAETSGNLEQAKHLNAVALQLMQESGATDRAKITAGSRETVAETNLEGKAGVAATTAEGKTAAAETAAEEKRRSMAFDRMTKIYEKTVANWVGAGEPPTFDQFALSNPNLAKTAGYEVAAPKTERKVVSTGSKNGRPVVKYDDGTVEYAD